MGRRYNPENKLCVIWREGSAHLKGRMAQKAERLVCRQVRWGGIWRKGGRESQAELEFSTAAHGCPSPTAAPLPSLLVASQT